MRQLRESPVKQECCGVSKRFKAKTPHSTLVEFGVTESANLNNFIFGWVLNSRK